MIRQHDPATRSLPRTVLVVTALLAVFLPLVQWADTLVFGDPDPIPPGPVWARFAAVMAVTGVCMGLAVHATARRPRGWPRCFVLALLVMLMLGGDIDDFASRSLDRFLLRWIVVSVGTALVTGSMLHAVRGEDEPRRGNGTG